jgi:subtilisin family serine protease
MTRAARFVCAILLLPLGEVHAQGRAAIPTGPGSFAIVPPSPPPGTPGARTPTTPSPTPIPSGTGSRSGTARAAPSLELPPPKADSEGFGFDPLRRLQPAPGEFAADSAQPANEPGELLVLWRNDAEADRGVEEITARFSVTPADRAALPALGRVLVVYRLASMMAAAELKTRLALSRPDWVADYNSRYALLGEPRLYAAGKIGLRQPVTAARPVHIGLLDTAVAPIPALRGARVVQRNFLASGEIAPAAHGTAIAALLLGEDRNAGFFGVARGSVLSVAQIVRSQARESTNVGLLLRGTDWLVGAGAEVINASLGGPPNRLLRETVELLAGRGIILVAAAGNGGPGAAPAYPAAYDGVVAVTATDALDRVYADANRGSYVDLSAPGVDLWIPGEGSGRYVTGTSFAAALVTGAIALRLSATPLTVGGSALGAALCGEALDLGDPGRDTVFGCGLLQLESASSRKKL